MGDHASHHAREALLTYEISNLREEAAKLRLEKANAVEIAEHNADCARAVREEIVAARAEYRKRWDCADDDHVANLMLWAVEAYDAEHARFKARGAEIDALTAEVGRLRVALSGLLFASDPRSVQIAGPPFVEEWDSANAVLQRHCVTNPKE